MYQPPQNSGPYWQPGQYPNEEPTQAQYPAQYLQPGQYPNGMPLPPPPKLTATQRFKALPKNTRIGLGCGTFALVLVLCVCSIAAGSTRSSNTSLASTTVTVISTAQPTMLPTMAATPKLMQSPTPQTTPSPVPTQPPTPTQPPVPTQPPAPPAPTQPPAPSAPTQPPAPQPTSPPTGVYGNPWGYNFTLGNLIYSPPSAFCTYFSCISSFSIGKGYVAECNDTMYSKSGGLSGACSKHGGEMRPLYSH